MSGTPRPDTRRALTSEMNLTPMIDVLLVLLITFMAAIPALMKHHTVDVQLPEHAAPGEAAPAIVLEVDDAGRFRINSQAVEHDALRDRLRALYAMRTDKSLFVKGSPHAKYDVVLGAMDVARGAGVTAIGLP